jgi:hypothetical protein
MGRGRTLITVIMMMCHDRIVALRLIQKILYLLPSFRGVNRSADSEGSVEERIPKFFTTSLALFMSSYFPTGSSVLQDICIMPNSSFLTKIRRSAKVASIIRRL